MIQSPRTDSAPAQSPTLRRALGRWDLTAIGINQVIGGAIFLVPSQIAAHLGNWSPIAFVVAGLASMLVALCFAEVGSRFDGTGGAYLYTRAAFGRFISFEVGWMQWFTRVTSQASIVNGIALALAYYWPAMKEGTPRVSLITAVTLILAIVNVRGIRQSSAVVNALTIGKLAPLAVFLAAGVFYIDWDRLAQLPPVDSNNVFAAALILIFAFGGFDIVGVPAGEAQAPRRHLPFALICTISAVTVLMTLLQIVIMTTVPDVTKSSTPLADSAGVFLGPLGAMMIGVGAVLSMLGNNAGHVLTAPRILFALAGDKALPEFLARIHPVYRTPANAIWFSSAVALILAFTGSFAVLAAASGVARLLTYTGVTTSVLVLRRPDFAGRVQPATFITPLGATIPIAATLVSLLILAGASSFQLLVGAAALAAGALLFAAAGISARRE